MKTYWPLVIVVLGALLLVGSPVLGALAVGIPGPEDTTADEAMQQIVGSFALGGCVLGVLLIVIGAVAGILRLAMRKPGRIELH